MTSDKPACTVDTLIAARWVVPVEPAGVVLEDHAVAVAGDRIVALLPATQARATYRAAELVELESHVLIPGLVNAHTHAAMSLMRGMADDLPLEVWLKEHIWPAEARCVSRDYVRDGTRLAVAEMLRGGTTCFNDMYFFPDVAAEVARACGMRACVGLIAIDFPSAWAGSADDYLAKGLALREALAGDPLVSCAFAPHAPYTVSDATLRRVGELARMHDLRVHIHVHETAQEVEQSLAKHGQRPLDRLEQLGLLGPRLLAVHLTQVRPTEIERLAAAGASVVHCPESNLKLASGFCPVARLEAAGVNLALGTDGAASNNDLDLLGEARTAALLAKGVSGDPTVLPAHRVLHLATLGGARALGLAQEIGSLDVGKQADLVAVDLSPLETQPVWSPVSHLIYACGRQQVSHVWVAGRPLLRERELLTVDAAEVAHTAASWREKLA